LVAKLGDVVFDAAHPASLARFWAAALDGYTVTPYDEEELTRLRAKGITDPEDDPSVLVEPPALGAPRLFFNRVPEGKPDEPRTDVGVPMAAGSRVDRVMLWLARTLDCRLGGWRAFSPLGTRGALPWRLSAGS
jgi:hypothetical protein